MTVIDIHPHIVSPDTKRYPLAPLGGTQSAWSSERPTTYEMLLKEMDAAGVAKAAIVHSSTAYGYDNSYVADAVAAVPSRFTGVYSIDVLAPDAVPTFDYWLRRGCTGMRLFTTGSTLPDQSTWFAERRTYPFWEHAAAKNIPVCMQMKTQAIPLLRQIMDQFPKLSIVLDHLSRAPAADGPPHAAAADLFALARYERLYLKVTPINISPKSWGKATPETFFGKLIDALAPRGLPGAPIFLIPSARCRKSLAQQETRFPSPSHRIRTGSSARPRRSFIRFSRDKGAGIAAENR